MTDKPRYTGYHSKFSCFECDGIYDSIYSDEQDKDLGIIKNVPIFECPNCGDRVIGQEGLQFIEMVKKSQRVKRPT